MMKKIVLSRFIFVVMVFFLLSGCNEGEDASLFNGVNELVLTGTIGMDSLTFDHEDILMKVHLFSNNNLSAIPVERISLKWWEKDDQGNTVAINETSSTFLDVVSEGDYYAYSFIDMNKNSEVDDNEPYDVWKNADGTPKVIHVREESRWEISFLFETVFSDF